MVEVSAPPLRSIAVLASPDACDAAGGHRVAPDEALVLDGDTDALRAAVAPLDPDALVVDVSGGWAAVRLEGDGARSAFARLSELELPPDGFVQGEVLRVGARVVVAGDRIDVLVPAMVLDHVLERVRAGCRDLLR